MCISVHVYTCVYIHKYVCTLIYKHTFKEEKKEEVQARLIRVVHSAGGCKNELFGLIIHTSKQCYVCGLML